MSADSTVTCMLAEFVVESRFDAIPEPVMHEAKRAASALSTERS